MNRAATLALTPFSLIFGIGVRTRNFLYRRGVFETVDVAAPVISIGNLTAGGTGKSTLVEWLAWRLATQRRVCILTRGYGRKSSGRVLVSDYHVVRSTADEAGDEPLQLAQNLRGRAAVICDADRVAAAHWAIDNLKSEIFILDDAFQHQRIKRNLNILTIDATNPWGNGKLLPAGILREPIKELSRADCIVVTRANLAEELAALHAEIETAAGNIPIFTSQIKLSGVRSLGEAQLGEAEFDRRVPVAAFCGIGNPDSFFLLLQREGYQVKYTRAFRDHHHYNQADIDKLVNEAAARRAQALVTTAKDAVKLQSLKFGLPCYVIDISIAIDRVEDFLGHVDRAIECE